MLIVEGMLKYVLLISMLWPVVLLSGKVERYKGNGCLLHQFRIIGESMGSVLFMGLATVDICNYVSSYPGSNSKVRAVEQLIFAGGPAANAAVSCSAAGAKTTLISALGGHPLALLALEDLCQHGVKVIDCQQDKVRVPVLSSITIDLGTGDRSVVYTDSKDRRIDPIYNNYEFTDDNTSLLMLDGHYLKQAIALARIARDAQVPVVLDGGSWKEGLDVLLPEIDYAICSADFFPPGCTDQNEVIDYLHDTGVKNIAISQGGMPLIYSAEGKVGEVDVVSCAVVDTLGAGDILHGTFCASLLRNDFISSLKEASRIASMSCEYRGTRSWINACYRNKM